MPWAMTIPHIASRAGYWGRAECGVGCTEGRGGFEKEGWREGNDSERASQRVGYHILPRLDTADLPHLRRSRLSSPSSVSEPCRAVLQASSFSDGPTTTRQVCKADIFALATYGTEATRRVIARGRFDDGVLS